MSRSYREPAFYTCMGATPYKGKYLTSRELRRKARQICHGAKNRYMGEGYDVYGGEIEVYMDDSRDRRRGKAGSRSPDWGWDNFGDGRRHIIYTRPRPREHMILPHHEGFPDWWYKNHVPLRQLVTELRRK